MSDKTEVFPVGTRVSDADELTGTVVGGWGGGWEPTDEWRIVRLDQPINGRHYYIYNIYNIDHLHPVHAAQRLSESDQIGHESYASGHSASVQRRYRAYEHPTAGYWYVLDTVGHQFVRGPMDRHAAERIADELESARVAVEAERG